MEMERKNWMRSEIIDVESRRACRWLTSRWKRKLSVRSSQDYLRIWWFTSRTHDAHHTVIFSTMIYYILRYKAKSSKGIDVQSKVWGSQVPISRSPLPVKLPEELNSSEKNCCKLRSVVYQGRSLETWVPRVFTGAWSISTLELHIPRFQIPRENTGVAT